MSRDCQLCNKALSAWRTMARQHAVLLHLLQKSIFPNGDNEGLTPEFIWRMSSRRALQCLHENEFRLKQNGIFALGEKRTIHKRSQAKSTSSISMMITKGTEQMMKALRSIRNIIRTISCTRTTLYQYRGLGEPPLAEGKARVRWKCVSLQESENCMKLYVF